MIVKFVPDIYAKSIYTINYSKLKKRKIKCLIFDLDNTLAPVDINEPSQKLKNLFFDLKEMGFHIIIASNSNKKRVEPFKNGLEVDSIYSSFKPFKKSYKKIMEKFNYKPEDIAGIGDQFITDIFGANRSGITSVLVNQISKIDRKSTKLFNRKIDNIIKRKLRKKKLLNTTKSSTLGVYYE